MQRKKLPRGRGLRQGSHYFLSRPRRFGKSLFLDTLKELFEGNRGLFNESRGILLPKSLISGAVPIRKAHASPTATAGGR